MESVQQESTGNLLNLNHFRANKDFGEEKRDLFVLISVIKTKKHRVNGDLIRESLLIFFRYYKIAQI